MKKSKCYIYTRVSTSMQVDGYSLDAQKEKLRKYAEFQEMTIAGEYSDEGKSGKNVEGRTDFVRMLNDIQTGKDKVDYVLVFKLSRFGRNAADVLSSLQRMQDYDVNLICVEDGIDSSKDSGKLMISVLSAVAEIERENILVQTMEGRKQKAREGKWNGGFAPYGYRLDNGELVIEESEAQTIRMIFDKYVHTNMGCSTLADWLNTHGYEKKKRQNGTLDAFSYSFVKGVICNPVYCGKIAYGRRKTEKITGKRNEFHVVKQETYDVYDGAHNAIVSEELWNLANEKYKRRGVKWEKKHSLEHENVLSGILKCPCCGAGMYGNVNRKKHPKGGTYKDYWYYSCKHRRTFNGHFCGYKKQWKQEVVDGAVADIIKEVIKNEKFEQAIRSKIESGLDTKDLENEANALNKQLRQYLGAKDKLNSELDRLDVTDKHYDRKYDDMTSRLERLYDQIDEIEGQIEDIETRILHIKEEKISSDGVYQYLLFFDKLYEQFTDKEKKEFYNCLLESVEIYDEPLPSGRFLKKLTFRFPLLYGEEEITGIGWDKVNHVESVVKLTRAGLRIQNYYY